MELIELVVAGTEEPRGPAIWYGQMVVVVYSRVMWGAPLKWYWLGLVPINPLSQS